MRRTVGLTLILLLAGFFSVDRARSESHRIEILKTASVNGVQLKPGVYRLGLNGANEVEIYKGRRLLIKAKVELVPLANAAANSVLQTTSGQLKEIRLEKERVVFADSTRDLQAQH